METPTGTNKTGGSIAIYPWAFFGLASTLFAFWVCSQWLLSADDFVPIPLTLADQISPYDLALLRIVEFVSLFVAILTINRYVLEPLRTTRTIPLEGMLVIGAIIAYCWDTTINYYDYLMAWNKHCVNFGTWAAFWPGHTGPTRYAEALFWGPPMYLYFGVGLGGMQWAATKRLQDRFQMNLLGALAITFFGAFVLDIVAESAIIRAGAYAWPKTIPELTLWAGSRYQFPLYEAFMVAIYSTFYALLFRSKEQQEISFIERGAERLARSVQFVARFLAAVGFASFCAGFYFIGYLLISLGADKAVDLPSCLMYINWAG